MKRLVTFLARSTSLIGAFVAVAVVMGLIAAGLAAPLVGAVGTAARGGVNMFEQLPGDLEQNPLAEQSRILAADGSLLSTPAEENRIVVPLEDISPNMQNAQVAIEDERFYQHGGMDLQGTARAFVSNQMNDDVQGGSTLTQQYVKLILLEQSQGNSDAQQALSARSGVDGYIRKLRELRYAVGLEQEMGKDEILEGYLNLVFYGQGTYGVEAAARYYFNTSAKDLTVAQSATLAGIVRSPSNTDPVTNPEAAKARRDLVLGNMLDLDMITEKQYEQATESEIKLDITQSQRSCQSSSNPYFCDYVTAWLLQQDALGDTQDERLQRLTRGGLTVETTLDPELSADINEVTRDWVPPGNEYELYSAAAMVEPGTGHVLAFGQSTTYDVAEDDDPATTSLNFSVDKQYGGGDGYQIGSIAKAYSLVPALEQGMPIDTTLDVPRTERWDVNAELPVSEVEGRVGSDVSERVVFEQDQFQPDCTTGSQFWGVRNAEGANYDTRWPLREATAFSVNTAFAQLASEVGTCNIRDTMAELGLTTGAGGQYGTYAPDYVLGSQSATPLTVATSYATFAAGGLYCPPVPVLRILDNNGEEIPLEEVECRQVIEPDVAAGVAELMGEVIDPNGSGFRAILAGDRPAAGKTGTNDPSTSTWFAGYTPQLSTAVWVGKGGEQPNVPVTEMRDLQIGDRRVEGYLYGSKFAAPLWKTLMDRALEGEPVEQFEQPSTAIVSGEDAQVPELRGLTREEADQALSEAGFQMQIHEYTYRSQLPEGQVVQSRPSQGTTQRTGTSVTVYLAGDGSSYEGPGAIDADSGQESDTESDDD